MPKTYRIKPGQGSATERLIECYAAYGTTRTDFLAPCDPETEVVNNAKSLHLLDHMPSQLATGGSPEQLEHG